MTQVYCIKEVRENKRNGQLSVTLPRGEGFSVGVRVMIVLVDDYLDGVRDAIVEEISSSAVGSPAQGPHTLPPMPQRREKKPEYWKCINCNSLNEIDNRTGICSSCGKSQ